MAESGVSFAKLCSKPVGERDVRSSTATAIRNSTRVDSGTILDARHSDVARGWIVACERRLWTKRPAGRPVCLRQIISRCSLNHCNQTETNKTSTASALMAEVMSAKTADRTSSASSYGEPLLPRSFWRVTVEHKQRSRTRRATCCLNAASG